MNKEKENSMSTQSKVVLGNGFVASLLIVIIAAFTQWGVSAQKENTLAVNKLSNVMVSVDYRLKSLTREVDNIKGDCRRNTDKISKYKHSHVRTSFIKGK